MKSSGSDLPMAGGARRDMCNEAPAYPSERESLYDKCQTAAPMRQLTDSELIEQLFSYVPPTPYSEPKFKAINQAAKNFAAVLSENCPPSTDRATALYHIRAARMFANAAISLNGLL